MKLIQFMDEYNKSPIVMCQSDYQIHRLCAKSDHRYKCLKEDIKEQRLDLVLSYDIEDLQALIPGAP